jgi:hypothetical protein
VQNENGARLQPQRFKCCQNETLGIGALDVRIRGRATVDRLLGFVRKIEPLAPDASRAPVVERHTKGDSEEPWA